MAERCKQPGVNTILLEMLDKHSWTLECIELNWLRAILLGLDLLVPTWASALRGTNGKIKQTSQGRSYWAEMACRNKFGFRYTCHNPRKVMTRMKMSDFQGGCWPSPTQVCVNICWSWKGAILSNIARASWQNIPDCVRPLRGGSFEKEEQW